MTRFFSIPPKWIVTSKTFLLNAALLAAALLEFLSGHAIIEEHPELSTLFVSIGVILNWIVRWYTVQPASVFPTNQPVKIEIKEIPSCPTA